jgi:succinyl-diaminopimelate desuccinylase
MKGAIGAYLAAVDSYLQQNLLTKGSLSILLTSDEEGPAIDGLRYVVDQLKARGEHIDACLVGEPTNMARVGDTVKVGRRGSLNATLTVQGKSGHVAYPHLAKNPIPPLLAYLQTVLSCPLDKGMPNFDPSHLEVTSVDVGNPTSNVIPLQTTAKFNIRFNPTHTIQSLTRHLHSQAHQAGLSSKGFAYTLDIQASGDAFFCEDKGLQHLVSDAILATTNLTPIFSTSGGTSDARFLKDICPVIEFGLINTTAHQVDEHIALEEIHHLKTVYQGIIERFFR